MLVNSSQISRRKDTWLTCGKPVTDGSFSFRDVGVHRFCAEAVWVHWSGPVQVQLFSYFRYHPCYVTHVILGPYSGRCFKCCCVQWKSDLHAFHFHPSEHLLKTFLKTFLETFVHLYALVYVHFTFRVYDDGDRSLSDILPIGTLFPNFRGSNFSKGSDCEL